MWLIIGGAGQGKLQYALSALDISDPEGGKVVDRLHQKIRERMEAGLPLEEWLDALSDSRAVICDEIGCGLVPMGAFERQWRDEVGRACQKLAARAERVIRVYCGIPSIIKGA